VPGALPRPLPEPRAPHIVALGAGYASLFAYRALAPLLRAGRARMTVIDRNNYHCFHGLVPEVLGGTLQANTILSPVRRLFRHARFCYGEITGVDVVARQVTFGRNLDGKEFVVPFDHLIVGLGTIDELRRIPGIAEHALQLKSFPEILELRHRLITMLELADIETDPEEVERLLTFVVAGGNYAGIEVAGELSDHLPRLARQRFPSIPVEKIRIVVVQSGTRILPELAEHYPRLQATAERVLAGNPHVRVLTGVRLASATTEAAVLSTGERVPTRTIISCIGTAPSPLLDSIPAERDQQGRLVTDACLRVQGVSQVWSAGDCAAVPHPDGGTVPPLAIWAMTAGRQLGHNIAATLAGREPRPYRFSGIGDACVLGHQSAVGHLKGIQMTGLVGYLGWRFFMVLYLPAWEKKLRLVVDWLLAPFFGRDLIDTRVHRPLDVVPVLYEPGQDIVREGDIGHELYIIRSGEVEVRKRRPDGSGIDVVAALGAGDRFGEVAVFEGVRRTATVRALTRVELLRVRRDAAVALTESSTDIARTLKATGPGAHGR
jgi:NADH:ubiquinone reductase (H+-translocating)